VTSTGKGPGHGFCAPAARTTSASSYGLKLVNDGTISAEQFGRSHEKIGGFDRDATIVPQRTVAT